MSKVEKPKGKYTVVIKYILILLGAGLFGAVIGIGMMMVRNSSDILGDKLVSFMVDVVPSAQWIVFLLLTAVSIGLYLVALTCTKQLEKNREDEALTHKADILLSSGMALCSVNLIVGYWLFGLLVTLPIGRADTVLANISVLLVSVGVLVLLIVYYSIYMAYSVKLTKRLYPEKKGDPLDTRFQKDWLASCDEAEKMVIYQASYKSYKMTGGALLILWVITVLCSLFFGQNGFAITVISIIWLVQSVSYNYHCMKLNRKKLN